MQKSVPSYFSSVPFLKLLTLMKTNKLSILFLPQKARINKKGICPVRCRITYSENKTEFATGLFINPIHWNSKQQIAEPPNEENNILNNHLSLIKNKINQAFLFLEVQGRSFTVEDKASILWKDCIKESE